jgi:hypothetical protein
VSCNDFIDCHDKIFVADVDFIGSSQSVAFICKERGASRSPDENGDSRSLISSSMVMERKSRFRGDESASYVVPNDVTTDTLLAI